MKKQKFSYHLGNILSGFVTGKFASDEEAWKKLSRQFDKAFPSENGRKVYMYKEVPIKYEFTPGTGKHS